MAYGSMDKKGRHRKERRNWKREYDTSMLEPEETQASRGKARRKNSGADNRNRTDPRTADA